jgi:hypothetical protein
MIIKDKSSLPVPDKNVNYPNLRTWNYLKKKGKLDSRDRAWVSYSRWAYTIPRYVPDVQIMRYIYAKDKTTKTV